jgi:hypothetical protein
VKLSAASGPVTKIFMRLRGTTAAMVSFRPRGTRGPERMRSLLRIVLIDHPLLAFLLSVGPVLFLARLAGEPASRHFRRVAGLAGVGCITLYLALVVWYVSSPLLIDHVEPSVMANSWLLITGHPLYDTLDSAEIRSLGYGPSAFLVYGLAFTLFGGKVVVAKLTGALGGALCLLLCLFTLRPSREAKTALPYVGLMALFFLLFDFKSFRARVDPFLVASMAAAVWGVALTGGGIAGIVCGVAFGFCVNVKLHGVLYCLPVAALLWRRHGTSSLALSIAVALATFYLPFLVLPQISSTPYMEWIDALSHHGLSSRVFLRNLSWVVFLATPVWILALWMRRNAPETLRRMLRAETLPLAALALGVVPVVIAGSKIGAGPHHLMPFVPLVVYALASMPEALESTARRELGRNVAVAAGLVAFAGAALVSSAADMGRSLAFLRPVPAGAVVAEVRKIMRDEPDASIQMGYGKFSSYPLSWYRAPLVFAGHPYLIDPPGDSRRQDLFGDEFREVFQERYEQRGTTRFFDPWRLREEPTTRPAARGPSPADDRSAHAGPPEPPAGRAAAVSPG